MNLLNNIKIGKIEWYAQKITSILVLFFFFFDTNIIFLYTFNLFFHIELGFDSILEDYYQNIVLKLLFNFFFKCISILTLSIVWTNCAFLII